ncbi:MAG: S8 family serine peptidase [Planctomycetota bacterium]
MLDLRGTLDRMADADGSGVRVAVIDTGVEHDHPWVGGRLAASHHVVTLDNGNTSVEACDPLDVCGHGTASAGQIRRVAPQAELISVRVLSATRQGSSEALVAALQWLASQDVHLVNLSLSTLRLALALRIGQAVDGLAARNIACVCALGYQEDGRDYPTSFASTIGVTYAELPLAGLRYRENDLVEFEAAGVGTAVAWQNGTTRRVTGSSYATPLVTGLAARMLQVCPALTPYELKTLLKSYADRRAQGWTEPWMQTVERSPAQAAGSRGKY